MCLGFVLTLTDPRESHEDFYFLQFTHIRIPNTTKYNCYIVVPAVMLPHCAHTMTQRNRESPDQSITGQNESGQFSVSLFFCDSLNKSCGSIKPQPTGTLAGLSTCKISLFAISVQGHVFILSTAAYLQRLLSHREDLLFRGDPVKEIQFVTFGLSYQLALLNSKRMGRALLTGGPSAPARPARPCLPWGPWSKRMAE